MYANANESNCVFILQFYLIFVFNSKFELGKWKWKYWVWEEKWNWVNKNHIILKWPLTDLNKYQPSQKNTMKKL